MAKRDRQKISMIDASRLVVSSVQPRTRFDDGKIKELANSIRTHGILQPLIVRRSPDGLFEIVAGERRFRAASLAGMAALPCIVMELVPEKALAIALVENIQRQDLNPIEEALAYHRLRKTLGLSQEEIAERVFKDRTSIANTMRLLRLPEIVQEMVVDELLTMGHARALLSLESRDMVIMLAKKIAREGLSVRKTEGLIRSIKQGAPMDLGGAIRAHDKDDPMRREIQQRLERVFETKVHLKKERDSYSIFIRSMAEQKLNEFLDALGIEI